MVFCLATFASFGLMSCRGADSNRASIRRRDLNTPIHGARIRSRAPARAGREEKREDDPSGWF
ncbi:hypothetical protein B0042_1852 [Bifidobacterium adolescentis]|nr:hypothetical protein B0042_1852 [Bifidobacterium adolescentis]